MPTYKRRTNQEDFAEGRKKYFLNYECKDIYESKNAFKL